MGEPFLKTVFYMNAQWIKLIRKGMLKEKHSRAREACILPCAPHEGQGGFCGTLLGTTLEMMSHFLSSSSEPYLQVAHVPLRD